MLYGFISVAAVAMLAGIDQLIKAWATAYLMPVGSVTLIPHVVELYYLLNDGMAFSMLSGRRMLLVVVTGVMLAALLVMLLVRKLPMLERVAWVLVVGGGIGNLIDRVLNGAVVDYINLLFMRFAVFNFADICVTVGVGLLILSVLLDINADRKKAKGEVPGAAEAASPQEPQDGNT